MNLKRKMNQKKKLMTLQKHVTLTIPGEKGEVVKTKILQLQQKNKGYKFLKNIGQVLSGNNTVQLPENYSPTMVADLQYSPVTLVDVERSFAYTRTFLQTGVLK
ncbi:unnamed protein product [Aphis gossypii]|uniref:Uncharacterized protein n=1 Tax=Aphis gossypii TaxID=80765 RepID=A0A9P0NKR1_APHGO|nr:unnamed protein product [Aphis gossypii]